MLNQNIRNNIQLLWDKLWAGGLSNPITAIEQISYLLFMRRLEVFKPDVEDDLKWSIYKNHSDDKLLSHIKDRVFQYIKNDLANEEELFSKAMENSVFLVSTPSLIRDCITYIDAVYKNIEIQEKEHNQSFQDIQGDVYEYLLSNLSQAGKNGQFRTPRHIVQMMARILDPDIDGKICDLACGSGGFLVGAYQHIITKYSKEKEIDENGFLKGTDRSNLNKEQVVKLNEDTFFGFDIDQTMVRIGMMNLMMHGITKPSIQYLDALSLDYEELEALRFNETFDRKDKKTIESDKLRGQYKYILANPPFTGKINSENVSRNLNRIYPLKEDKETGLLKRDGTVQSELLFLERMIYMLEDGGKAAVIVPEGLLFNTSSAHTATRKILMHDCDLQGVISLPGGVFYPYTGVKTSILIFEKKAYQSEEAHTVNVWFYDMNSDGYSLDTARNKLKENPLPTVLEAWNNGEIKKQENRKLQYFTIHFEEIVKNKYTLNLNQYKEFEHEAQEYRLPKYILEELFELENEIIKGLNSLSNEEI